MPAFININPNGKCDIFLDPTDITGVFEYSNAIIIHNSKGEVINMGQGWDADLKTVVSALAQAGVELKRFEIKDGSGKAYGQYISPKAVTFATTSQADANGRSSAIIGVEGYGALDSVDTTPSEIADLMAEVRRHKPQLMEIDASEAHARFYSPDKLYIDPKSVYRIQAFNERIDTSINWYGKLDIELAPYTVGHLMKNYPHRRGDDAGFNYAFQMAMRDQSKVAAQARAAGDVFAAKIAAGNEALFPVSVASGTTYLRREDVSYVTTGTYKQDNRPYLGLHKRNPGSNYPDTMTLVFNTEAERDWAFARLTEPEEDKKPAQKQAPKR